ncbi:MAG TPA: hypothetical protein VFV32_13420 [Acidimicrobiales bacterium]|jgi:hypothetical protein|nr:hypothetical protein [Acidimicrobiales bacterium]
MSDEQDRAEALDADELGEGFPPDEPLGVDEAEVTPLGERTSESFEERDARQETLPDEADRPVIRPYHEADEDLLDDEAQAVADAEIGGRDRDSDDVPESAEEAALHLEGD